MELTHYTYAYVFFQSASSGMEGNSQSNKAKRQSERQQIPRMRISGTMETGHKDWVQRYVPTMVK